MTDTNHPFDAFGDNGLDQCVRCGETLGGEGNIGDPVVTEDGTRHESIMDTHPGDPAMCPECYDEFDAGERAADHQTLDAFTGEA